MHGLVKTSDWISFLREKSVSAESGAEDKAWLASLLREIRKNLSLPVRFWLGDIPLGKSCYTNMNYTVVDQGSVGIDGWIENGSFVLVLASPSSDRITSRLSRGSKVHVDQLQELPGGTLLAHVDQGASRHGWVHARSLRCESGDCGHCHVCDEMLLPSEALRLNQSDRRAVEESGYEFEMVFSDIREVEEQISLCKTPNYDCFPAEHSDLPMIEIYESTQARFEASRVELELKRKVL